MYQIVKITGYKEVHIEAKKCTQCMRKRVSEMDRASVAKIRR